MLKQREEKLTMMGYPVGENLVRNMPIINEMAHLIRKEYDTKGLNIWCRGSSGAIIGALIGAQHIAAGGEARVCHIKKPGESSHSSEPSYEQSFVHIMVDDFISSGDTIKEIWNAQQRVTQGDPIDLLIVTSGTSQLHVWAEDKLRKIISG